MKHLTPHGHAHDHLEGASQPLEAAIENVFTLAIVVACLFIPFAFVINFFPW